MLHEGGKHHDPPESTVRRLARSTRRDHVLTMSALDNELFTIHFLNQFSIRKKSVKLRQGLRREEDAQFNHKWCLWCLWL